MFIGRQNELQMLEDLYRSPDFQFLVLYGRRRVGKTSLLQEFSRRHRTIFYSAQEKNDTLNLTDFSAAVQNYFDKTTFGTFSGWETALDYVGNRTTAERTVLIIDEFPFIAGENRSIKSILQHTIDHSWKEKNLFLILCGSSVSFMENEVMGYKSPLYGRATAQYEVLPFDYYDSALFLPGYSVTEKLMTYGILGGIPCYLQNFSDRKTLAENISTQIFRTGAFLKEEPQVLLKMELREPAVYNSILEAIAGGASRLNEISGKIHEDSGKCSRYIDTLRSMKLVDKIMPCGEEDSRKSIYRITDQYFLFWYHFIFTEKSYFEIIGPTSAAEEILTPESFSNYMGSVFEQICAQYMTRLARLKALPFIPHKIGKWWGNNPARRGQDDVDVLLLGRKSAEAIFCECKYKNEAFDKKEFDDLVTASLAFPTVERKYFYLFSEGGFTQWIKEEAAGRDDITLVTPDDLFSVS